MDEKLFPNFPPDSMMGDNAFPKNLKTLLKNEWLRVVKRRKRISPYDNSHAITFVLENGQHHLVWAAPSMIERTREYEKYKINGQNVYIKYVGFSGGTYSKHTFDSILY